MGSDEPRDAATAASAAEQAKKDALYENRPTTKKIIRLVTVVAYMVSVSFVAIVLSGYYIFLWQPPNPRLLHRAHLRADPQIDYQRVDEQNEAEVRDRINVIREQILRNRGINVSVRESTGSKNFDETIKNLSSNAPRLDDTSYEALTNNSQLPDEASWNPVVRAFLASRADILSEDSKNQPDDVYEGVNNDRPNNSLGNAPGLFIETTEINGQPSTERSSMPKIKDKSYEETTPSYTTVETFRANITRHAINGSRIANNGQGFNVKIKRASSRDSLKNLEVSTTEISRTSQGESTSAMYATSNVINPPEIQRDETTPKLKKERKHPVEIIVQPKILGLQTARAPAMEPSTNDRLDLQKPGTTVPEQLLSTDNQADLNSDDTESASESLLVAPSSPLIIQPEPSSSHEDDRGEESIEERLSQQDTSDFDFI